MEKKLIVLVVLFMLLVVETGCGGGATDALQEASDGLSLSEEPTATADVAPTSEFATEEEVTKMPSPTVTSAPPTEVPTATPLPPTATPTAEQLVLSKQGFGQDGISVAYAFVVENPNGNIAYESVQYQAVLYDADGGILKTDSGWLEIVFPEQKLAYASEMYLDEGMIAASMEVRLSGGEVVSTDPLPVFGVADATFHPDDFFPSVTAVISSPYQRLFEDVRVSAVVYNEADEIIGGGYTYQGVVPAEANVGTKATVTYAGEVARVEVYPVLSSLSLLGAGGPPDGADSAQVVQVGFGQDGQQIGIGFLVQNPNDDLAIEGLPFVATIYDGGGAVIGTADGYVPGLHPGVTLGIGLDSFVFEGTAAAQVVVHLGNGRYVEPEPTWMPFTSLDATYRPGSYGFDNVTGFVVNPYDQDVSNLRVSAIVFNEAGDIIGGGFTFLDFASASTQTAVEVSVTVAGTPTRAELYPALSNLSDWQ